MNQDKGQLEPLSPKKSNVDQSALADKLGQKTGFSKMLGNDFSFQEVIGGPRGLFESVAPTLVFVLVYLLLNSLTIALVSALVFSGVLVGLRLGRRSNLTQAFGGIFGIIIGACWAWKTGQATDFFAWGIYVNVGYALVFLISMLAKWPLIGVLISFITGKTQQWRQDPARKHEKKAYWIVTSLWLAMFVLRLVVQLPLFYAGALGPLAVAKLALGVPLFVLVLWISWLFLRSGKSESVTDQAA